MNPLPVYFEIHSADNSCSDDFCYNGGSCSQNSYGDLECSCVGNWTGGTCADISCPPDFCSNGGSCSQNTNGYFICLCDGDWTGDTCTEKACPYNLCSNGGSCSQNSNGVFICLCDGNWTGDTCTEKTCPYDLCSNGGSCSQNSNGVFICLCDGNWTGNTCTGEREKNVICTSFCAENVDDFLTKWSITPVSRLSTLDCTGDYTGNASRYCSRDGKWEKPNYNNCISKSIQHIKNQVNPV
ncbi:unnamed protein product [Mytilus edulis]|uniref:Uncharacterized protein n=1 Tax=Mytilus edulis TaxID=6550 RepID=A0A8S3TV06_MYTED|nr:unnamed protein product [Mytilus edulis]